MLISSLRCFCFHVPRCGGTSINEFFRLNRFINLRKLKASPPNLDVLYGKLTLGAVTVELDHITWEYFAFFCSRYVQETFRTIAVIRDPLDRAHSVFNRMKLQRDGRLLPPRALRSFDAWVNEVYRLHESGAFRRPIDITTFRHSKLSHLIPQAHFILSPDGHRHVDDLIPFDDLGARWPGVCKKLGIRDYSALRHPLAVLHSTERIAANAGESTARQEVGEESSAKLRQIYADDFALCAILDKIKPSHEVFAT